MYPTRSRPPAQRPARKIASRRLKDVDDAAASRFPAIRPTGLPAEIVLGRLTGVSGMGPQWSACCPAHCDLHPSLSITEAPDRSLLIHCHAGCAPEDVMAAVALQMSLLFPSSYALRFGKAEGWRGLNQRPGADNLSVQEPAIDHAKFEKILKMSRQGKGRGLQRLAKQLGLPVESLDALHIGSQEGLRVFPECDDQRRLVGLLYRAKDGSKTCESGSHRGLTIPSGAPGATGPLYIVEGATDTAALHSVAMAAIGRPAARASGLVRLWLVRLLRPHRERDVIVVGDRDPVRDGKSPGRDGARELALYLRISLGRPVVWALPCRPYKDVREQVAAGEWHRGLRIQEAR